MTRGRAIRAIANQNVRLQKLIAELKTSPKARLVTEAAGFIGSHLLEALIKLDQRVVGLDNLPAGSRRNLALVSPEQWARFQFVEGNTCDAAACRCVCDVVDFVLHQAALGSVPRSLSKPLETHIVNVAGFVTLNMAAQDAGVKRFVFASSCAVYGDYPGLPKVEEKIEQPLSPYATPMPTFPKRGGSWVTNRSTTLIRGFRPRWIGSGHTPADALVTVGHRWK